MEEGKAGRAEEGEVVECYHAGIPVGTLSRWDLYRPPYPVG